MRTKKELELLFGEWLLEKGNDISFCDNSSVGNTYYYNKAVPYGIPILTRDLWDYFIKEQSLKDCPCKLICNCDTIKTNGFCGMNKKYGKFLKDKSEMPIN